MNRIRQRQALIFLFMIFIGGIAHGQTASTWQIETMKVAIWPEYDDPRVFVTYRGKLPGDAVPPVDVRFLVPKGAEISHTCGLTPAGEHQCRLPRFTEQAGGLEVSYAVPTREFLIEMYYDPFTGETVRDFEFPFTATHPIRQLTIEVQKPLRATSFQVEPAALTTSSDGHGFQYYQRSYSDVTPGQTITTKVMYAKSDNRPSVRPQQNAASVASDRRGGASASQAPRIVAIVMASLLVLGLGAYWIRSSNPRSRTTPSGRKGASKPSRSSKVRFCPSCGAQVQPQHRFCAQCGETLK